MTDACVALRAKFPGLGAKEYGRKVVTFNGLFDRGARERLLTDLQHVLDSMPVGAEVLGEEIVLFCDGSSIGFYFVARP
jgi:hypothetical protein